MVENRPGLTIFSHVVLLIGVAVIAFPLYVAFVAGIWRLEGEPPALVGSSMGR